MKQISGAEHIHLEILGAIGVAPFFERVAALLLITALISTASANTSPRVPDTVFPCHVAPDEPEMGFDLRFHAGYRIAIGYRSDDLVDFQFKDMSIRSIDPTNPLHRASIVP